MWPRKAVEHEFNEPPKIRHDVDHAFWSSAKLVGLALLYPYLLSSQSVIAQFSTP